MLRVAFFMCIVVSSKKDKTCSAGADLKYLNWNGKIIGRQVLEVPNDKVTGSATYGVSMTCIQDLHRNFASCPTFLIRPL